MISKDSKIYLAGHTGLVGSAILKRFQKAGYKNLITKSHKELDLIDQQLVENFFKKVRPEYVIIAAAKVGGINANITYPAEFLYENTMIQNNLLWNSYQFGIKKLLFLGSGCIYPKSCPQPMKEEFLLTGELEPTNESFAIAKIAGLKLCESIAKEYRRNFFTVIPTGVYGPKDNFDQFSSHVIPALIRKFTEAKRKNMPAVTVWGTGKVKREFLYVDDLADAIFFLMQKYNGPNFLNIGAGYDIKISELAKLIQKLVGFAGKLEFDTTKPDGMPRKLMDIKRLEALGWKAKTSLEEGLRQTINWYTDLIDKN